MCADWNYLVVSDLHIGELAGRRSGTLETIRAVDRALIRFVDWYAEHRVEGRRWRLIIAGDGIDFLHFSLKSLARDEAHDEALAVSALEAIVTENRSVFSALARFVAAGHELVVLQGNHDAELHWDRVQDRLRELLVELYVESLAGSTAMAGAVDAFRARISVHRWFYHHRGLLYVEHGNQYDELCSFEHVLWPVGSDLEIEAPLSHVTLRVFADVVHRMDVHVVDRWGLGDFLRWLLSLGPRLLLGSAGANLGCAAWLVRLKHRLRESSATAREHHARRMSDVARSFDLEEEAVHLLDRLKRAPAGRSVLSGFRMLFFDQLLLALTVAAVLTGVTLGPGHPLLRTATGAAALAAGVVTSTCWRRWRRVDAHPKLLESARRVAGVLDVRYVVFGHSHVPHVRTLEEHGSTYVNTGSWTHDGDSGLTHLCVAVGAGGPRAELRRWNPATSRPDPIALCQ